MDDIDRMIAQARNESLQPANVANFVHEQFVDVLKKITDKFPSDQVSEELFVMLTTAIVMECTQISIVTIKAGSNNLVRKLMYKALKDLLIKELTPYV